jgi:hypothetical protein
MYNHTNNERKIPTLVIPVGILNPEGIEVKCAIIPTV